MANFFSSDYWKAFYFLTLSGDGEVDPNALRGVFAGSSSWTGDLTGVGSNALSGSFAGSSSFSGLAVAAGAAKGKRRRGGGDDGPRVRVRSRKRSSAYVEYTEERLKKIKARELAVYEALLEPVPVEAVAPVELVAPPPLPAAVRQGLDPSAEYSRVMSLLDAGLRALNEGATRRLDEQLRKKAKQNKVEPPSRDADRREAEIKSLIVWLDARAALLEAQRIEDERLAMEQDEEDVILLLLAA